MELIKTDILIVGGGFAGKLCAILFYLKYKDKYNITIVSKSKESNSQLAQGGIAISIDDDDIYSHIEDTIKTGCDLSDRNVVEYIIRNSYKCIDILNSLGFEFEKEDDLTYKKRKEGGHSRRRVFYNTDFTGKKIMESIDEFIINCKSIKIIKDYGILELVKEEDKCIGGYFFNELENKVIYIDSNVTILSSGGVGGLFQNNSGIASNKGEGIVAAYKIGASVSNMRFIQFHPTAFTKSENNQTILITEALRGEGAKLINSKGERFLEKFGINELSPRDSVSRAIYNELQNPENKIYLDCSDVKDLGNKFKNLFTYFKNINIDMTSELIPVSPVPHYLCGGININLNGETNIKNLLAVGECSNVGLHGANRLASNSLLEIIIISNNIVENTILHRNRINYNIKREFDFNSTNINKDVNNILELFSKNFNIVNNYKNLNNINIFNQTIVTRNNLSINISNIYNIINFNILKIIDLIINDSINYPQSKGCFFIKK